MPRAKRPTGDKATNARKRYYRASERYLKQSESMSGAAKERYRALAKTEFEKALSTYSSNTKQRFSKPMQRLADEFSIGLESRRDMFTQTDSARRLDAISETRSRKSKASFLQDDEDRKEFEAEQIFKTNVGSRIIGGLEDVWRDEAVSFDETGVSHFDRSKIFQAIKDFFNVDKLYQVLEKIEEKLGKLLYAIGGDYEIYETVKLTIANKLADNTLVE